MKPWRTSITVNKPLWLRFKATLALQEKDMSAVLEDLIAGYLQAHEAKARDEMDEPRRGTR